MAIRPGDSAPDFTLASTQGEVTLSKLLGAGDVLLVFYPGDDTPVCTKQLCDYRDNLAVFGELGVQVLAINPQELASHQAFADKYGSGPTRVQFLNKDPRGWQEFRDMLAEHSMEGAAYTMRGVQKERPSLFDLEDQIKQINVPTLVITGDEDEPCLLPNIYLKRIIPTAALEVLPNSGHTINLEEPALFNAALERFLAQVESGRWPSRDPRSLGGSIIGMK